MATFELTMPKMGESIIEATILNWNKNVGDEIEAEETVLEIATDKVDSEVPSPVDGKLLEIKFETGAVVPVGEAIAIIETESAADASTNGHSAPTQEPAKATSVDVPYVPTGGVAVAETVATAVDAKVESNRF
ncbi:MAG: biotin/lipoyl-containing protein, partial [Bacteroidota bacterium]